MRINLQSKVKQITIGCSRSVFISFPRLFRRHGRFGGSFRRFGCGFFRRRFGFIGRRIRHRDRFIGRRIRYGFRRFVSGCGAERSGSSVEGAVVGVAGGFVESAASAGRCCGRCGYLRFGCTGNRCRSRCAGNRCGRAEISGARCAVRIFCYPGLSR